MPATDISTVGNLAVALTTSIFLGFIVSVGLVKIPYIRKGFVWLKGRKFLGENAQLLVVILATTGLGLIGFLYVHHTALSAITLEDLFPLFVSIATAIGSSQWYNDTAATNTDNATITVPSSPGSAAVTIAPQPATPPAVTPAADKTIGG